MDEKDFAAHLREHQLMTEAHKQEHDQLARIMRETADRLERTLDITATRLAQEVRDTAELHWQNHLLQHQQSERAVDKAAEAASSRMDISDTKIAQNKTDANEWRGSMDDREVKFATKADAENNAKDVGELQRWRASSEGKMSGQAPIWALILTIAGVVSGALILHFLVPR